MWWDGCILLYAPAEIVKVTGRYFIDTKGNTTSSASEQEIYDSILVESGFCIHARMDVHKCQ